MSNDLPDQIVDEIREAIFAGKKIEAIKLYREAADTGLKEAKEFIEKLTTRLYEESPDNFTKPPGGSGCAGVLVVVTLAIGVGLKFV
ncbi:MAG: ribosomal protein L7/L12 [Pirellulales bacterium]|nr:ribosomal protein L7/L12 [Pirellulales bacterium]